MAAAPHTNIGELRDAISLVVKMLANKGIKVTQSGIQAFVQYDERTLEPVRVNIPSISDKSSPELVTAIKGFVDHEVGHLLFSDAKIIARAHKEKIANLHNIVEDTFIEAQMKKAFAGATKNIDKTVEFAIKHFFQKAFERHIKDYQADDEASQAMFFVQALATPAIRALAGQEAAQEFMADKWELIPDVRDALMPLESNLTRVGSSLEALKLANTIRDLLAEVQREQDAKKPKEEEKPSPTPPPSKPAKSDDSRPGDSIFDDEEPEEREPEDDAGSGDGSSKEDTEDDAESGEEFEEEGEGEESDEGEELGEGEESDGSGESGESDDEGEESEEDGEGPGDRSDTDDRDGEMNEDEPASEREDESIPEETGTSSDKLTGDQRERELSDKIGASDGVLHDGTIDDHPELKEAIESVTTYDSALESVISDGAMESLEANAYMPFSTENDKIEVYTIPAGLKGNAKARQEKLRKENGERIGVMSKALERLMMARNRSMFVPGFRSGRLHSANLYKLSTGDTRVFRRKEEVRTKNTAVLLLVDCSGSMNYRDRIVKASDAAYALCTSLDRVGVKTQVVGFTTQSDMRTVHEADKQIDDLRDKKPDFKGGFDRVEALLMPIYKTFDERLTPDCEQRIASLPFLEMRNNADGECVEIAANMLRARQEERKILVVLSDGAPAMMNIYAGGRYGRDRAEQHLTRVVKDTEASGIETLGIGIETDEVRQFYPKCIVLDNVAELPTKIVSELSAMLLR